jgi:phage-related protein
MNGVGKGVQEIRIEEDRNAYRVIYLANLPEAVYVLHCFQKKSNKTSRRDLDVVTERFKDLMRERKS